jgi:hypothetical protein
MKARFLRERALEALRGDIENNLERYRKGDFEYLARNLAYYFETPIDIDEVKLRTVQEPADGNEFDAENSLTVGNAMGTLGAYQAGDERLWAYLTHTLMLGYTRARWPIPEGNEQARKHIENHFFGKSLRGRERDNAVSRLWWFHHVASRTDGLATDKALEVLLFQSDVRANLLERPTTAQSIPVFSAVMAKLSDSYAGKQNLFVRNTFRTLMIKLNGVGGHNLLDVKTKKSIEHYLDQFISTDLGIKEL